MKKFIFQFVLVVITLMLPLNNYAQKDATIDNAMKMTKGGRFIDTNYKITKPLLALRTNGKPFFADESKSKVTFEIVNFGNEGNTVIITFDIGDGEVYSYSWSGTNLHVAPAYDSGMGHLAVVRGNNTACGALSTMKGKWVVTINTGSDTYTISDIKKGMTRAEIETKTKELGLSQFKFNGNSGKLKVYSLLWLDQKKVYNYFGDYHYQLRNDKKYGDFYFDDQGKLVKWLLYM